MEFESQIGQDKFVVEQLNNKQNGTFLDIGACYYKSISNTYYLEKALGWRGIAIDIESKYQEEWSNNRENTIFVIQDATQIDYKELCSLHNFGPIIDYLSLDLEPPDVTFAALQKVLNSGLEFNVITFETDYYRYKDSREPSRRLLDEHGYELVVSGDQDDFYISRNLKHNL
jgi:hypothetical protein